jgi:hypothetical protein
VPRPALDALEDPEQAAGDRIERLAAIGGQIVEPAAG